METPGIIFRHCASCPQPYAALALGLPGCRICLTCSKAGEDGLAGICDRYQILVFALALWNGKDPILKERLFGLVPAETNHGEDVKEYYFYLDSTPTHSYMKYLYKYPQEAYPYQQLIEESRKLRHDQGEYELLDTGIFDSQRYFDVFVEYAKASPEDICIRIEVCNRGPERPQSMSCRTCGFATPGPGVPNRCRNPVSGLVPRAMAVSVSADDSTAQSPPSLPLFITLASAICMRRPVLPLCSRTMKRTGRGCGVRARRAGAAG